MLSVLKGAGLAHHGPQTKSSLPSAFCTDGFYKLKWILKIQKINISWNMEMIWNMNFSVHK